MSMIGTPLSTRSLFAAVTVLGHLSCLLADSASAAEIATLNGNELSRVGQLFETRDVRARRTSCSLEGPADRPASKSLLTPRLDYRADSADEQFYSLPWIDDGKRVWGMSETVSPLMSGTPLHPGFVLFRIDRRRFTVPLADAATDKSYLVSDHDDWGVAGQRLPVDPQTQRRAWGGDKNTHVAFMQDGMQFSRFDRFHRDAADVARLFRFALEGLGSQSVRLFALSEPAQNAHELWPAHDQRMLHIFDYAFRDVKPIREDRFSPEHRWEGVWTKARSVASPIVERFHVAKHPDGNYLITEDGQPYLTRWKKPGADADLRLVSLRGGELIQYIIHDADRAGRAFAFTTNYWFELKEPLEYHEFDLGAIDVKDPMTTLFRCAKELRRHYPTQSQ